MGYDFVERRNLFRDCFNYGKIKRNMDRQELIYTQKISMIHLPLSPLSIPQTSMHVEKVFLTASLAKGM